MFNILSRNPIFNGCSKKYIENVLEGLPKDVLNYSKDTIAYDGFKKSKSIMFLLSGSAKVEQHHEDGTVTFMKHLVPGDVFGVLSIFSSADFYPTHVSFDKASRVLCLTEESVLKMLYKDSKLLMNYLTFFNGQVQYLLNRIELFAIQKPDEKILQFFDRLMEENQGLLSMTKVELSEYLGLSRSTLYRTLDKLHGDGKLVIDGKHYHVTRE